MSSVRGEIGRLESRKRLRMRMAVVFACLAVVAGLVAERLVRQDGITLTGEHKVLDCHYSGSAAHTHNADCYDTLGYLVCPLQERERHVHDDSCYTMERQLVCTRAEDGTHVHDDSCYEEVPILTCGREEISEEHVHGEGCFRTVEVEARDMSEEELETAAPQQLFHEELKDSTDRVTLAVDVDAPVGALPKNSVMRVSELTEDEVDQELVQKAIDERDGGKVLDFRAVDITFEDGDGNVCEPERPVIVKLTSPLVKTDDVPVIVHIEDEKEAQERAQELGLSDYKVEGEVVDELSAQQLLMRDEELAADQIAFDASRFSTYVLAITSTHQEMEAEDDASSVTVKVDAPKDAGIPSGATLRLEEIDPASGEFKELKAQAAEAIGTKDIALARFFDISILTGEEEIQPTSDVSVTMRLADAVAQLDASKASVIHFGKEPKFMNVTAEGNATSFETDSFSVFGVIYTVDFSFKGYTYTLPGEGQLLLSELIGGLGIDITLDDIKKVEFSNPDVMDVEKADATDTIYRIVPDTSGRDEVLRETDEVTPEEEEATKPSDPRTEVKVREGDYILTSTGPFDTSETLAIHTLDTVYAISVKDPPLLRAQAQDKGPWNLVEVAKIKVSYDNAYTSGEQDRDASFTFHVTYHIDKAKMSELKAGFTAWDAWTNTFPTFNYDISGMLASSDLKNIIPNKTTWISSGKKRVAKLTVAPDGKVKLEVTDLNWFLGRVEIEGAFDLELSLDENEAADHTQTEFRFPGTTENIVINYKTNIDAENKTVSVTPPTDSNGNYYFNYTAKVKSGSALDSLQFVDTIGGKQKLVTGSVKLNDSDVAYTETGTGFTVSSFPTNGEGKVNADDYTITYQTMLSHEDFESLRAGQSSWETNQATWKYNGDRTLDGGSTSYEVKKPAENPPAIAKSSDKSGAVQPGDTINYTITVTGQNNNVRGLTVTDNMTDLQYITGTPTVKVDGTKRPDLVSAIFAAYNKDDRYSSNNTAVINYTFPDDFVGNDIEITYATKVIDQDAATANTVYGQNNVNNTFSENRTWQNKTTTTTVSYEEETPTPVSKSVEENIVTGAGENYKELTYTIVVGDGSKTLDGMRVKDCISGNQQWETSSFTMSGNNINFPWAPTYENSGSSWNQTAFDFTFPAGTGKGPVIITYKTRTLADADAKKAGIYSAQTLTNSVDTGTAQDTTSVDWTYPEETRFNVNKSVKNSSETSINGQTVNPGDTLSYSIVFGDENTTIDSNLRIMDEMVDLQDLVTGDDGSTGVVVKLPAAYSTLTTTYTFWDGTKVEIKNGEFMMPKASNGWDNKGVTWGYFNDGSYGDNRVRLFNFQFPDITDNAGHPVTGPVTVEYQTKVIASDDAGNSNVSGAHTLYNTATSGNGSSEVSVNTSFGSLKHEPALTKRFLGDELGWDKDGYSTWWAIRIEANAESSYPLTNLTLKENWDSNAVYYSTEYPVQNFAYNKLEDIDLLGAEIVTDSGVVLQAGRDYTIDKQKGSFHFDELGEAVTVKLAIHNPDATINTFYQHNQVELTYQKDKHNTGLIVDNATCKRVKQDIDITKKAAYDESKRTITWTVELNPYTKDVIPDWAAVPFKDKLPDGLEYVDGSLKVKIMGSYWSEHSPQVLKSGDEGYEAGYLKVGDISLHTMWGANINKTLYYNKVESDGGQVYEKVSEGQYNAGPDDIKVDGVGTGLSGTRYEITYQTKVPDSEWDAITSSLTGTREFTNTATIGGGDQSDYTASSKVEVESDNYLKKYDDTRESADYSGHRYVLNVDKEGNIRGYAEDGVNMRTYTPEEVKSMSRDDLEANGLLGNQLLYRIEVNPQEGVFNGGKRLTLTDRIDTNMEIETASILVYTYEDGEARAMSSSELAEQGITLSYNDDTRYLMVSGMRDQTHYRVTYLTTMRAFAQETFSNTATLIGGGNHSDKVTDSHEAFKVSPAIAGNSEVHLTLKKIDENNITVTLPGSEFKLYECQLSTPYGSEATGEGIYGYKNEEWQHLLEDVESTDEAVIANIKKNYVITGATEVPATDPENPSEQTYLDSDYDTNHPAQTGDKGGYETGPEGLLTFKNIKDRTLYYWVETDSVEGYTADLNSKHYFVVYVDEDYVDDREGSPTIGEILATAHERKSAAWALDDVCTIANGITVASMSAGTVWNVTNRDSDYTHVTVNKVWEGDYDNTYETRPKTGILYDLYQIDANGKQTLVADRSPVPINVNKNGYWDSFTWYGLSSEYTYTVRERPVSGYITSYSDDGKGIANGTITVTNTYIPKNTEIYVQKKWDPADGAKPNQVIVKLYQITHTIDKDGKEQLSDPVYTGEQIALTASNGWKDGWTGLPTKDDDNNTLTYTVTEDVASVNSETNMAYGPVYSDDGVGVVSASAKEPLVITNVQDAPGSLKITKHVTVNGQSVTDTAADGVYRFRITDKAGNPATHMHDHKMCKTAENPAGTLNHTDFLVGDITVEVKDGRTSSTMVDDLEAGTYYVEEYSSAGTTLTSGNRVKVEVEAGVTKEDFVDEAEFTNDMDKTRVRVTKTWENASGGNMWPADVEVKVKLTAKNANQQEQTLDAGVGVEQVLSAGKQSHMWDNLAEDLTYSVEETGIKVKGSSVFTPFDTNGMATVTIDGKPYTYRQTITDSEESRAAAGSVAAGTGKTYIFSVKNTQVADVLFVKKWGAGGKEAWPQDTTIEVQLYKDGVAEDNTVQLTSQNTHDARSTLGGFTYTWSNLEADHTYSVKEVSITDGSGTHSVGDEDLPYIVTQEGDLRIHNLPSKTSVNITKTWEGGTPSQWRVEGRLSRERRTMEPVGEWEPDLSYAAVAFDLTNSNPTKTINDLDLSGYVHNKLYEYRYIATETGAWDTSSGSEVVITSDYTATVDGYSTITITNVPKTTSVSVSKKWEGGTPAKWRIEGYLERNRRTYGSSDVWTPDSDFNNGNDKPTFTITQAMRSAKTTVDGLPASGYEGDTRYEYQYVAVEDNVYDTSVSPEASIKDDYTRTSVTSGNDITLTNTPKTTSISIKKMWKDKSENVLTSWPQNESVDESVTGWIKREKCVYGQNTWDEDPSYSEPFEIKSTDTHEDSGWNHEVGGLPTSGYEDGKRYEYRYSTVTENAVTGYSNTVVKSGDGTSSSPYVYTITNTAQDIYMSVTVNKEWRDSAGNTLQDASGKWATFELHQVRRSALVVNITDLDANDEGSVTLTISDGSTTTTKTLNKSDYVEGFGWHYVMTPLESGKTYTVTSATGDGTNIPSTLNLTSASNAVSGDDGGTVTYERGSANVPTITFSAPTVKTAIGDIDDAWISIQIWADAAHTQYFDTITLSKSNGWSVDYTATDGPNGGDKGTQTAGLTDGTTYYFSVPSTNFNSNVIDSVSLSPASCTPGGDVEATATAPSSARLTIEFPEYKEGQASHPSDNDAWIEVAVTKNGRPVSNSPVRLNNANNWTYKVNMEDGVYYNVAYEGSQNGTGITSSPSVSKGCGNFSTSDPQTVQLGSTYTPHNLIVNVSDSAGGTMPSTGSIGITIEKQKNGSTVSSTNGALDASTWSYTYPEAMECDATYVVTVGNYSSEFSGVNIYGYESTSINDNTGDDRYVTLTATQATPTTHSLTITAKDSNGDSLGSASGSIGIVIKKTQNWNTTEVDSATLNSTDNWTHTYNNLESDAEYSVEISSHAGFSSATINGSSSVSSLSGSTDHNITITSTVDSSCNVTSLPITVHWPENTTSGMVEFVQFKAVQYSNGIFASEGEISLHTIHHPSTSVNINVDDLGYGYYRCFYNYGKLNGNDLSSIYIDSDDVYIIDNPYSNTSTVTKLTNTMQISNWTALLIKSDASIEISFATPSSTQSTSRIVNPITMLFSQYLANTGNVVYGTADVVYAIDGEQTVSGNNSYSWQNLPRFDDAGYPIEYYVVEKTSSDANAIVTHGDDGFSAATALTSDGTVNYYNTVPETEATVKLRKQFTDSAGNPLSQADVVNASASFSLKRYKNSTSSQSASSGDYTINLYYSDYATNPTGSVPFATVKANDDDIVRFALTCKDTTDVSGGYGLHFVAMDNNPDWTYLMGNGEYDFSDSSLEIEYHFKITNSSIIVLKRDNTGYHTFNYGGNLRNIYLSRGSQDNSVFLESYVTRDLTGVPTLTNITPGGSGNSNNGSNTNTTVLDASYTEQTIDFPSDSNVTWAYNQEDKYWEATFKDRVPQSDSNGSYTYYVEETTVPSGYEASYTVGDTSVSVPTSAEINNTTGWETGTGTETNWLNGSGTVTVTNKDLGRTSVSVEKKWKDVSTDTDTTSEHTEDVEVTLYQCVGTPDITLNGTTGLALPSNASQVTGITNPVTLTSANRAHTWTNLPTKSDSQDVYYYVKETSPSDDNATYTYAFNDETNASTKQNTGVKSATITNNETSISAKKVWKASGVDITDEHTDANHTLTLTLYKKVGNSDRVKVEATDTLPNPVKLNAVNKNSAGSVIADLRGMWEYTWTGLPLRENGEDVTYEVEETATTAYGYGNSYGLGGTCEPLYVTEGNASSGIKGYEFTNNETSVQASKVWMSDNVDTSLLHQFDTVTLQLYVARKVSENGTYKIPTSAAGDLKLPHEGAVGTGNYASCKPYGDAVTLRYDSINNNWSKHWDHLPTTEVVDNGDGTKTIYELAYFVKEVANSAGDVSATYSYGDNDSGFVNNSVSSVSITNQETSVSVSKTKWGTDDTSVSTQNLKHKNDRIALQLYKARMVDANGNYKIDKRTISGLTFPVQIDAGATNGDVESFEAYGSPVDVEYNATTKEWGHTWSSLPTYETDEVTGTYYRLAYFVREIGTSTGTVSPTYSYVSAASSATEGSGYNTENVESSGVKRVVIENEDTEVSVEKIWKNADGTQVTTDQHGDHNVTVQLYKARIAKKENGVYTGDYKLPDYVTSTGTLMLPVAIPESEEKNGEFRSFEAYGDAVILSSANQWKHTFDNLPKTEVVEREDGTLKIYKLAYFVKEIASTYGGATTTYVDYEYNTDNDPISGVKSVDIVNKESDKTRVQVRKVWGDGNDRHADGSVTVKLQSRPDNDSSAEFTTDNSSAIVLNAENNWTHVWENLDADKDYHVLETGHTPNAITVEDSYNYIVNKPNNITYATITNKPTYHGGLKITKTFSGLPAEVATADLRQVAGYKDLEFVITAPATVTKDNGGIDVHDSDYTALKALADRSDADGITYILNNIGTTETPNYQHCLKVKLSDFVAQGNDTDGYTYTFEVAPDGLTVDRVYTVKETNAETLIAGYSIVATDSKTSGNASIPKMDVSEVSLNNTYEQIKGSIEVTKNVTLNHGQDYDDVAAQQRFGIGLQKKENGTWVNVKDPADPSKDWVKTIIIGSGSKGTASFEGLELGVYRAYEVADSGQATTEVVAQEESTGSLINGYSWDVTQTGTYFTYAVSGEGEGRTETRTMVTGDGTYNNYDGEGAPDESGKVTITGNDGDTGVVLSAGASDELAPRNAEITITNDKTETGKITINKRVLYNGELDTTALGTGSWYDHALKSKDPSATLPSVRTVKFGLYKNASATEPVKDPNDNNSNYVVTLEMGKDPEDSTKSVAEASVSFEGLDYEGGPYYVFELDDNDQPIKGSNGTVFGLPYTVVASGKGAQNVSHEDREKSITYTNSYSEKGSIKVTKSVMSSAGGADEMSVGEKFNVGLFTRVSDNGTPDDLTDDTYKLVTGRKQTITMASDGTSVTGETTFTNLDFDAAGTTYYVFEMDGEDNPVLQNAVLNGYKVTYGNAGAAKAFELTPERHNYVDADGEAKGAYITNTSQGVDLRVVKVDKKDGTKALAGAAFTVTQLDETNSLYSYRMKSLKEHAYQKTSAETDANGTTRFRDIPNGYYEVKETKAPSGYVAVGSSTFYIKVENATLSFLERIENTKPSEWTPIDPTSYQQPEGSNVKGYALATGDQTTGTPATATIENSAGTELPSTGGIGTHVITCAGMALVAGAAYLALRKQRRSM